MRVPVVLLAIVVGICGAQDVDEKVSLDDAQTAFNVFDYNDDGVLSTRELRGAVRELGFPLTRKEGIAFFRAADKDGDGKITFGELSKVLRQFKQVSDDDDEFGEAYGDDED